MKKSVFKPVVEAHKGTVLERVNEVLVNKQFIDSSSALPEGATVLKYTVTDFQKALFTVTMQLHEEIAALDKEAAEMLFDSLKSACNIATESEFMDQIKALETGLKEVSEKKTLLEIDLRALQQLMSSDFQRSIPEVRNGNCAIHFYTGFQLVKEETRKSPKSLVGAILDANGPFEQIDAMEAYDTSMRSRMGFGHMFETHSNPAGRGFGHMFETHNSPSEISRDPITGMLGDLVVMQFADEIAGIDRSFSFTGGKHRDFPGSFAGFNGGCEGCDDIDCLDHPLNKL